MTILFVEDELDEVTALRDYTAATDDFEVVASTGSAEQALRLALVQKPDILIVDIELEEGNGISFLEELRHFRKEYEPFIFVLTRMRSTVVRDTVEALGADFFYCKKNGSYTPESLIGILRNLVRFSKKVMYGPGPTQEEKEKLLRLDVQSRLESMAIPATSRASGYFVEAVVYSIEVYRADGALPRMKTQILPHLLERFEVLENPVRRKANKKLLTKKAIEDAMYYDLLRGWSSRPLEEMERKFPHLVPANKDAPTVKAFIDYLANVFLGNSKE